MNEQDTSGFPEIRRLEVLEVTVTRGKGTERDPCRYVRLYFSSDDLQPLAEYDPVLFTAYAPPAQNH